MANYFESACLFQIQPKNDKRRHKGAHKKQKATDRLTPGGLLKEALSVALKTLLFQMYAVKAKPSDPLGRVLLEDLYQY